MTVVVYRDGIIAADSSIYSGSVRSGTIKKVYKSSDGWLAGGAGTCAAIAQFFFWMELGRPDDHTCKLDGLEGMAVDPKGNKYFAEGPNMFKVTSPWLIIGVGESIALGALEMGATAEEAVKACIKHHSMCHGKVQILKLKED